MLSRFLAQHQLLVRVPQKWRWFLRAHFRSWTNIKIQIALAWLATYDEVVVYWWYNARGRVLDIQFCPLIESLYREEPFCHLQASLSGAHILCCHILSLYPALAPLPNTLLFCHCVELYTLLKSKLTHFKAFQLEYIRTYNNNVIQDLPKLGSQQ